MELNQDQKDSVTAWVAEGCGLSEIQRRLSSQFDINMTFMDVRFLILDLGLEIHDARSREPEKPAEPAPAAGTDGILPDGGVQVEVDRVVKPGALVSGTVVFSDGIQAGWMLDQTGRLSLSAPDPEYRPSPDDVESFQRALQEELAKRGFGG